MVLTREGVGMAQSNGERTMLADLVDRLHPAVLSVLAAPKGLDVPVSDAVIFDPADPLGVLPDALVLGVGVDTERDRVALLRRLADDGATAVVLKHDGDAALSLTAASTDTGVAVLAAPPALAWGQLYTFLSTAASTHPASAGEAGDVPLGDLFALANAVAAMVGGATTIEDVQNRVLAYSSLDHRIDVPRQETILGRQVPSTWIHRLREAGVFRRLWQSGDVVRIDDFDDPGYLPRRAVAVRAGGEALGSIWVIEGEQPFGADAERALREAADIAALHLLRHRTAHDVDRRQRADALLALLDGRGSPDRARDVLRLDPGAPFAVVAFDTDPISALEADPETALRGQRVADLVAAFFESYRRQAACVPYAGRVYALVPQSVDGDDRLRDLTESILDRAAESLRVSLVAGIGGTVSGLGNVAAARREADQVADVLRERDDARVAHIDEVRAAVVVRMLVDVARDHPGLLAGRVRLLAEQDAEKGTSWLPTLRSYFDAFGDMAAAARAVNVHPNTFRYRIRRIGELFGIDLADPDERLVAEVQVRLFAPD
jgi:DNA-binding PucR family transcriptional regulator